MYIDNPNKYYFCVLKDVNMQLDVDDTQDLMTIWFDGDKDVTKF